MRKIFVIIVIVLIGFTMGEKAMSKENSDLKQKNIVMISSYTATGDIKNLELALNKGLDEGLTENEIKEILVQLYAYCGFPRSLNGINTYIKVTDERKKAGKKDKIGIAGKPLPNTTDKKEYGSKIQTELIGMPAGGRYIEFTPAIDEFLKSHLFADIFARGVLTNKERETVTIAALSSMEGVGPQLNAHIQIGKNTGLTDEEINEILNLTKYTKSGVFSFGKENTAYAEYFTGKSYLHPLTADGVSIANVTFEPACRNNWHIHHKGGQILLVTSGRGYYQEWGKPAQELHAGDVVNIPAGVKHWHGAAKDSWFNHIAIAVPAENAYTEWLEAVSDDEYNILK
ncbi:MAG: carboxymuconolactone decarboxylase family protein [Candidatus Gastranaerophilales bacterium]|nr:carboxymuconolactone decarboxylase family protein [Candidatus Gastranaerophilales bacterium]